MTMRKEIGVQDVLLNFFVFIFMALFVLLLISLS